MPNDNEERNVWLALSAIRHLTDDAPTGLPSAEAALKSALRRARLGSGGEKVSGQQQAATLSLLSARRGGYVGVYVDLLRRLGQFSKAALEPICGEVRKTPVNPHVLIVGPRKSGGPEITKSLISALAAQGIPSVIFDHQGEYAERNFFHAVQPEVFDVKSGLLPPFKRASSTHGKTNFDLDDTEDLMVTVNRFMLENLYTSMQLLGPSKTLRVMVCIDEAHKLKEDATVTRLIKEGRRYGLGLILSSKHIRDFDPAVLTDVGTLILLSFGINSNRLPSPIVSRGFRVRPQSTPPSAHVDAC